MKLYLLCLLVAIIAQSKSPVLSHATSSLSGLATIRSCNAESILRREFDSHQDNHTSAHFLVVASSVAFSFWIDVVSLLFVAFVTFSFVATKNYTASYVGLSITQVIGLFDSMQSFMQNYGDYVTQMKTVERMFQVVEVEQEVEDEIDFERPPIFWPERAEITFENVSLSYSGNSELALKNVSFSVKAGAKIGIVGNTGSGKSSLIAALFRLVDIEGSIFIDDIDIRKIDLIRLREKISIIPENPVIFTTTVRKNLDAYNRFDDSVLWSALDAVELKPVITSLDLFLDHSGACLSIGQRQLLCLARTILEGNRILVLDEATANVDAVTKELIKHTVRKHFKDCTVITIARRLHSVLDNDKIIVMDRGRLVEYDRPSQLLEKKDGCLARMVEETGRKMAEQLRRIAEQAGDEDMRER